MDGEKELRGQHVFRCLGNLRCPEFERPNCFALVAHRVGVPPRLTTSLTLFLVVTPIISINNFQKRPISLVLGAPILRNSLTSVSRRTRDYKISNFICRVNIKKILNNLDIYPKLKKRPKIGTDQEKFKFHVWPIL